MSKTIKLPICLLFVLFAGIQLLHAQSTPPIVEKATPSQMARDSFRFPIETGWVNDFEEVLDTGTENRLTHLIVAHNKNTTNQISIVTISSIAPYQSLSSYATDLSNDWGVGEKGKNNGVTILYSKALHEVRIVTGLGLEKKLPDSTCEHIIDTFMIPPFKQGNYGKGLIDGVAEIIRILESK